MTSRVERIVIETETVRGYEAPTYVGFVAFKADGLGMFSLGVRR